ncbi:MAG: NADH-quinone oxidoreductase subunit M [Gammaproteobacteria bacterium PRO9]|nr:NADH-quinone oxidoreductase subunit M [Gammaproteobacteria bacterium PRO9]
MVNNIAGVGILSIVVWLPIIGGLVLLAMGKGQRPFQAGETRWDGIVALVFSVLTFVLSIPLWTGFDPSTADMQFVERMPWITTFKVQYYLGVDGFSMPLILLTTLITPVVVLAGWESVHKRTAQYFATILIMEGLMIGVFASLDALLFYVFWEAMLIPMFIIIGVWGGERRVYATIKFFLYTFFGSVFMLIALIYLYLQAGSYSILDFQALPLSMTEQVLIFLAFLIAFAVKVPMWPVHTWLPDAHVEAPAGGSVILAAILLKMGGYGFVRFSLPITPDASGELAWLMIALSLVAVVYICLVALVQEDMKKLIAYSSITHMGFVTMGFFIAWAILAKTGSTAGVAMGLAGGMFQMISHGFISGALFLCVGSLYDRLHTRRIDAYGGVVNTMPRFAVFMVGFAFANAGLPGTSGFVGEFLVILASMKAGFWAVFLLTLNLILGACYSLWLIKRVIFGPVTNEGVAGMKDVSPREFTVFFVLAAGVLILGFWPEPLMHVMSASVDHLVTQITHSKLQALP